jgi:hypothetical protein
MASACLFAGTKPDPAGLQETDQHGIERAAPPAPLVVAYRQCFSLLLANQLVAFLWLKAVLARA